MTWLVAAQLACLVISTILILMQNRGSGLGSTFGGSDDVYLTKRGIEKSVVTLTTVFIVLFVVLRILDFYI